MKKLLVILLSFSFSVNIFALNLEEIKQIHDTALAGALNQFAEDMQPLKSLGQEGEPTGSSETPFGCMLENVFETEFNGHFSFLSGGQFEIFSATTFLKCINAAKKQLNYPYKEYGKPSYVELSYRDDRTIFSGTFEQLLK